MGRRGKIVEMVACIRKLSRSSSCDHSLQNFYFYNNAFFPPSKSLEEESIWSGGKDVDERKRIVRT